MMRGWYGRCWRPVFLVAASRHVINGTRDFTSLTKTTKPSSVNAPLSKHRKQDRQQAQLCTKFQLVLQNA
jgi:hypothetical protein